MTLPARALFGALLLSLALSSDPAPGADVVRLSPAPVPAMVDAARFGLNLGGAHDGITSPRVKWKAEPWSSEESTQMRPP